MPKPPPPVPVLVHGFLGFARVGPLAYFRGVEPALRADGFAPLVPTLPPTGAIATRAKALARALEARGAAAYVLIGHSMGGLDARYVATHLDPGRRVRAVVTVGTPHLGSPVAQRYRDGTGPLYALARRWWGPALADLDPRVRADEPIPDRPDVRYESHAAQRSDNDLPGWLRWAAGPIEGAHDGLVPVAAAGWGRAGKVVRADHLELVGWSLRWPDRASGRPFDHVPFWRRVVADAVAGGA